MNLSRTLDRRTFVVDLGRGSIALAVLGVAGLCARPPPAAQYRPGAIATGGAASPDASPGASAEASELAAARERECEAGAPAWSRVNLGFVSAYILVHGGEAAIVDTGVEGSGDAIAAALTGIGLDWPAVAHVILTHNHGDHAGSAADVLDRAADADGLRRRRGHRRDHRPAARSPRSRTATPCSTSRSITAPGHTAGSIAVLDPAAGGILVAGDAMGTSGGAPSIPAPQFTADMDQAKASIVKLGDAAVRDAARRPRRADRVGGGGARRGSSAPSGRLAALAAVASAARAGGTTCRSSWARAATPTTTRRARGSRASSASGLEHLGVRPAGRPDRV